MTEYEDPCPIESNCASYTAKNSVSFINVNFPAFSSCNVRNNCWSSSTCCYCFLICTGVVAEISVTACI